VIFRQARIGRGGEPFTMLKFRSMIIDAEDRKLELMVNNEGKGGLFKLSRDPRVTRLSKLLRDFSLDELLQLFNVLAGSMSLVGPLLKDCCFGRPAACFSRRRRVVINCSARHLG
jgi:lipopolysaccharide/colanic/teichoic acid biosynthesis glycosyltransferase